MRNIINRNDGRPNYWRLIFLIVIATVAIVGLSDFLHGFYEGYVASR